MKNNINYYRHEVSSHNHWKFKTLRRKYTWSGEGKFWALNNLIAESPECKLDVTDDDKKSAIAAELDFDVKEFEEFVHYLIAVCKLVRKENNMLYTESTQEVFIEVNEKRERQRIWKKEKSIANTEKSSSTFNNSTSKEVLSIVENEQSKVNESKVNESKVKQEGMGAEAPPTKRKFFIPPDLKQVEQYFLTTIGNSKNANAWPADKCHNEAAVFIDHYIANGWVQKKGKPIVDWQAACRNFIRNDLKGTFSDKKNIEQKKDGPPPKLVHGPVLDKIQIEINYMYDRFKEDENNITVISVDPFHYNKLKQSGLVNFDKDRTDLIKKDAELKLNGRVTDSSLVDMMKRIGVIECFKDLKTQAKETVFNA